MARDPYKYFRIEARELLEQLGKGVLDLEKGAPARAPVAQLLRAAHTLKGAARVVKQLEIADGAHAVEDALTPFRDSSATVPGERLQSVLALLDEMTRHVVAIAAAPDADTIPPASANAASLGGGPVGAPPQPTVPEPVQRSVRAEIAEMDALLDGVSEVHARLDGLRRGSSALADVRHMIDLVSDQLAARPGREAGATTTSSADRVRSLVEELRGTFARVDRSVTYGVEQMERELRQVRDVAERMRLVRADSMFNGFERAVRDVAHMQHKCIAFVGRGGDVRLDAHVLGGVEHALQQLVRNAAAHGIEPAGERVSAGKQPEGRVTVEVARRGRCVVFTCTDDGRGIDLDGVRRALERAGQFPADAPDADADELLRRLLRGGVSTSRTVTEISGRGIGLDLVRDAVERLGGETSARTKQGGGTTIEIAVPALLGSIETLMVEAGGISAMIPLDAVQGTRRVAAGDVASSPSGDTLLHEGAAIPFRVLSRALRIENPAAGRSAAPVTSAVLVRGHAGVFAFGVDRLSGTARVVLRPLPELALASTLVAGATLDAQGTPQLVLDPDGMVAEVQHACARAPDESGSRPRILIVDDSLTTRMLEQSILESAGYAVETATSAEEGLIKAHARRFGLFLVDVEMPGMDGFTFIERLRADPRTHDVPAILVTSRNSSDDVRRGTAVGANGHIVKSEFDQKELLDRIASLTAGRA